MNTTQSLKTMYDLLGLLDCMTMSAESYLKMAFKEDGDRAISIFRDYMDAFCNEAFIPSAEVIAHTIKEQKERLEVIAHTIKDQNERLEELNKRQAKEKEEKEK